MPDQSKPRITLRFVFDIAAALFFGFLVGLIVAFTVVFYLLPFG